MAPPNISPRGACTWKIALKYKVKQRKNGKFTSNYKASPINFETQISLCRWAPQKGSLKNIRPGLIFRILWYMLSDDINARFGKYLTSSLSSPSDILNCERRDKELSSLEDEIWKEKSQLKKVMVNSSVTMVKYMTGTKRQTNIWKFGKYTLRSNCWLP